MVVLWLECMGAGGGGPTGAGGIRPNSCRAPFPNWNTQSTGAPLGQLASLAEAAKDAGLLGGGTGGGPLPWIRWISEVTLSKGG